MKNFEYSINQLSLAHLRRIAFEYQKNTEACEDKRDFANLLINTMTKAQKVELLRKILLAGRTSMAMFKLSTDDEIEVNFKPNFKHATANPQVVHVGKIGDTVDGQQHIMWALLDGTASYINVKLELEVEPRAVVVDSFYEPGSKILQVRGNYSDSQKIGREFAKLTELDPANQLSAIGLRTRDQMFEFADLLGAKIVKCKGQKRMPKGFVYVSGEADAADDEDARNSPDYKVYAAETDPINETLGFTFNNSNVKVGIAFITRSIVFKTAADEATIQYVYGTLREYLGY